jgi:hypothetical protein
MKKKLSCKAGFHSLIRKDNYDIVCIYCGLNVSRWAEKEAKKKENKLIFGRTK